MTSDAWRATVPRPAATAAAGCSTESLAARFASEDLRNPIIKDNLADEDKLAHYISACRLDTWLDACAEAAKQRMANVSAEQAAEGDALTRVAEAILEKPLEKESEYVELRREGSEAFEGDDEDEGTEDTEMED